MTVIGARRSSSCLIVPPPMAVCRNDKVEIQVYRNILVSKCPERREKSYSTYLYAAHLMLHEIE